MDPDTVTTSMGDLAIAFANCGAPSGDGSADALGTPDGLRVWMLEAGILTASPPYPVAPPEQRLLLAEARRLRSTLRDLIEQLAAERLPTERTRLALDRVLRSGSWTHTVSRSGDRWRLHDVPLGPDVVALLAPVARSAVALAMDVDPTRLRQCAASDCARWFLDTSKAGRRRWCSMATCGNRAKAARYRARQAGDG